VEINRAVVTVVEIVVTVVVIAVEIVVVAEVTAVEAEGMIVGEMQVRAENAAANVVKK
jgi:hypothetical protein